MRARTPRALTLLALAGLVPACRAEARRPLPAKVDLTELHRTYGEARYSQDDEETLIRAFFQDRRGGFFLDVGAGDPIRHSTTYYLEKHLHWTGIAVDAIAEYAEDYARQRPDTRFVSYFAGARTEAPHDFFVSEERNFSSGNGPDPRGGAAVKRQVPTIALDDLLAHEHASRIDLLSLDIEGAEPAALAGLDIARYRPELACIEIGSPEIGRTIGEYFALHGCREVSAYRAVDAINRYYSCR